MSSRAALARHPVAIAGAVIATVAAVVFIALAIAVVVGLLDNPYAGLVVFIVVPALFVLGLLLIPLGMWLQRRKLQRHPEAVAEWSVIDFRKPRGPPHHPGGHRPDAPSTWSSCSSRATARCTGWNRRRSAARPATNRCTRSSPPGRRTSTRACAAPTVTSARARARSFTTSSSACGSCTTSITRQIPRPIPGVADLRPALEVCGNCHWPNRDLGDRVRVVREYADDEPNTETTTVLHMFTGGPGKPTRVGRAIHWHADPRITIDLHRDRQGSPDHSLGPGDRRAGAGS